MPDRYAQPPGRKGSLRWVQMMVNDHTNHLSSVVGASIGVIADEIRWVSPMADDDYAEYRDQGFLDRLDITLNHYPLKDFWAARGPQWDALGRIGNRVLLVEAKAHLAELKSPSCQAGPASLIRIETSLALVKSSFGAARDVAWTGQYYQYANRLAHLYLLRELNHIPCEMVNLCFLNDHAMNGPATIAEWHAAFDSAQLALGIQDNPLLRHVHHVFVDVADLER